VPHYFAKAKVGKVYPDKKSGKGDLFATITEYSSFSKAVFAKNNDEYLEVIPESKKLNYWRDGVRQIDLNIYNLILSKLSSSGVLESTAKYEIDEQVNDRDNGLESYKEGKTTSRYVTTYERNPQLRKQAIAIHGDSCIACKFNFGKTYGEYAEGFIHIHHIVPVSEYESPQSIDPEKDLVPLCANCHSVVHRKRKETLTVEQLKTLLTS